MVKTIEAISDVIFDRIQSGKATTAEKISVAPAKFIIDHAPRTSKFLSKHYNKIAVGLDILLAVQIFDLGRKVGANEYIKDSTGPLTVTGSGFSLSEDGKSLVSLVKYKTAKGVNKEFLTKICAVNDLNNIYHLAGEALANNGVTTF